MLSHYIRFVDELTQPAFIWAPIRGIVHANVAACYWTDDFVQHEVLCVHAQGVARSCSAEVVRAAGVDFLMLPLLGGGEGTAYVAGIGGAPLAHAPMLLHGLHESSRYFSEVVHLLQEVVLTARPDGRFDFANRRWYELTGRRTASAEIRESLGTMLGNNAGWFFHSWLRGIDSGEEFSFEIELRTQGAGPRWFELRAAPWRDGGILRKWIATLQDINDRVVVREQIAASRRRANALAEIGAIAIEDRDDDEAFTAKALAAAAAALPGTYICCVDMDETRFAVSHPPNAELTGSACAIAIQGDGQPKSCQARASDGSDRVLQAPLELTSAARNHLVVFANDGAAPFDESDAGFLSEIAWRIGAVLRNRAAHEREARIARVLQTGMLPAALPRCPTLQFDVAYQPAENRMLVGGDWYDAFPIADGRLVFSIGDVAGHGLEAAVIMGQTREILRTMALQGATPASALAETNAAVIAAEHGLISACIGYVDPVTLMVEYATAGHAPPLIISASGEIRELQLGDVILGAVHNPTYHDHVAQLQSGDALVAFTDGLVEYSRNAAEGEATLHAALSDWAKRGFRDTAHDITRRVLAGKRAVDDVALLTVRAVPNQLPPSTRRAVPLSLEHATAASRS